MTEDQDNAGEVVAGALRVALTAAGQLAEQAARRREADLHKAERDSAARLATLQSQLAAERELSLQSVRDVVQRGDAATVEEVVCAWEQARSWDDPAMGLERAQLEERIRERFGVASSGFATKRSAAEDAAALALVARDVELQANDGQRRPPAQDRLAVLQAGIDEEGAAAQVLADESYPIHASQAAWRPRTSPMGKPRAARRS